MNTSWLITFLANVLSSAWDHLVNLSGTGPRDQYFLDCPQFLGTRKGSAVTTTCVLPSRVVSGSRDATLRVWDVESGQCLHVLMGHVAAVRCVQYDGQRVVSGAYDYMVKVWDPETETCLHTLQGHTNRVYSLQVS